MIKRFNSLSIQIKVALIGAAATLLAGIISAVIVGMFSLKSVGTTIPSPTPPVTPVTTPSVINNMVTPISSVSPIASPGSIYVFGTEANPLWLTCPDCGVSLNIKAAIVKVVIYQGYSSWYLHLENHSSQLASNLQIITFDLTNMSNPNDPIQHCKSDTAIGNIAGLDENHNQFVRLNCVPQEGASYSIKLVLQSGNNRTIFVQNDSENSNQYINFSSNYLQPN